MKLKYIFIIFSFFMGLCLQCTKKVGTDSGLVGVSSQLQNSEEEKQLKDNRGIDDERFSKITDFYYIEHQDTAQLKLNDNTDTLIAVGAGALVLGGLAAAFHFRGKGATAGNKTIASEEAKIALKPPSVHGASHPSTTALSTVSHDASLVVAPTVALKSVAEIEPFIVLATKDVQKVSARSNAEVTAMFEIGGGIKAGSNLDNTLKAGGLVEADFKAMVAINSKFTEQALPNLKNITFTTGKSTDGAIVHTLFMEAQTGEKVYVKTIKINGQADRHIVQIKGGSTVSDVHTSFAKCPNECMVTVVTPEAMGKQLLGIGSVNKSVDDLIKEGSLLPQGKSLKDMKNNESITIKVGDEEYILQAYIKNAHSPREFSMVKKSSTA